MVGLRFFVIVLSLIVCTTPARARTSAEYAACSRTAMTQMAMDMCASEELERAERALNAVYAKLLAKAAGRNDAVAKIRTSESAWVAYRNAYMDAMFPAKNKQAAYGSIYPMEYDLLRNDLTQQHTLELGKLLKNYTSSMR